MLRLVGFIGLFLVVMFGTSQTPCNYTLQGRVLDEHNQEPLAFAFIVVEGTSIATTSDSLGNYIIRNVCSGKVIVHCDHLGCERIIDTLFINKPVTNHDFFPEHHVNELGLLELHVKKLESTSIMSNSLTNSQLDEKKTSQLGEAVSELTGVQNQSSGSNVSKPAIHGMHSNRVLILNNEIRQEGQQWGTDHGVELDFTKADEVVVLKGANALEYGSDAIGGVIKVNSAPLRIKHGIDGSVSLASESNGQKGIGSAVLNGNFSAIPQLSYRLQGSLKKGGNVNAPEYFIDNTGFEEQNYSWAVGYLSTNYGLQVDYSKFNAKFGIFSGAHIGNLTDLNLAFEAEKPNTPDEFTYDIKRPFQEVSHETVKAKAFFNINDSNKLELIYGRQFNKRMEFDNHSSSSEPDFDFSLTTHTVDLKYKLKGVIHQVVGVQGSVQKNTWRGRFFIPNYEEFAGGGYWIGKYNRKKHLLDFGVRGDINSLHVYYIEAEELQSPVQQFSNVSGAINYKYRLQKKQNLYLTVASAWRPPSVNELYSNGLHHGSAAIEVGDDNLKKEQVFNFNSGYEFNGERLRINSQVYFNYFTNYIYLAPTGNTQLTIRGAFPVFEYQSVKANINGIDLDVEYDLYSFLNIEASAGVLRANNLTDNKFLWGMPSDEYAFRLNCLGKPWKRFKQSKISVEYQHVTQQIRYHVEDDFVAPPSEYGLLNITASTQLKSKLPMELFFKVNNVTNKSYRSYLNRFRYFTDELGRNFVLGLKINFEIIENHHKHL